MAEGGRPNLVSGWKKLLRETTSSKASGSGTSASCPLPPNPTVASLKQPEENEVNDPQAQPEQTV
ncbi:UNVERIFIED_CONTAM: hypothetical protein Slati_3733700 [Sesamum latifolium]|uniref:Uncharacterized protein n=1 Tax=Sesamum latifolium TaxID=2727402 RepID=A0AAW2U2R1_9LAMI